MPLCGAQEPDERGPREVSSGQGRRGPRRRRRPGEGPAARLRMGTFCKICKSLAGSFPAVSKPIFASRIFWFQLFLLWQPSKLPKSMKNQETVGIRRFSNKESHLPFSCRLQRRAKFFGNLGIFEKTPIDESLNPLSLIHI